MKIILKPAIYYLAIVSSTLFLSPNITVAITVEEVTNPREDHGGWVTDMANILSKQTELKLNTIINNLEQKNGTEIAVVTVPDTAPYATPKTFATKLFNHWGIGKAATNNGILFLISVEDRRVEIETGLGIEPILSNAEVKQIIDNKIVPQFQQSNFDRGTLNGTEAIILALDNSTGTDWHWGIFSIAAGMGLTFITGVIVWQRKRHGKVFVNPQETNLSLERSDDRAIYCAKCFQPMVRVETIELTQAQQVEQKLGAISFRSYKCPNCNPEIKSYLTISYLATSSRYRTCPECKRLTVIHTKETLKPATRNSKGKLLISDRCHYCDYLKEKTRNIPRLPSSFNNDGVIYSRQGRYHDNSSYSGNSFSGGGSSGSSFGGGSSNGGGAGGSW